MVSLNLVKSASTAYNSIFESQVLTYLRLPSLKLGMIINFGERAVKDGIDRIVNRPINQGFPYSDCCAKNSAGGNARPQGNSKKH